MMSLPFVSRAAGGGALVAALAGFTACAPASQTSQTAQLAAAQSSPVLLSCPVGQQPLLRQVVVNGGPVPQVECVTAPAPTSTMAVQQAPGIPLASPMQAPAYAAPAPVYASPAPVYAAAAPAAIPAAYQTPVRRPAARRAVYADEEVLEYKKPRSWKKSAVIIGSAAGIGAGVGGATKGKKGALLGAAIGGGAAAIWDQVTRR